MNTIKTYSILLAAVLIVLAHIALFANEEVPVQKTNTDSMEPVIKGEIEAEQHENRDRKSEQKIEIEPAKDIDKEPEVNTEEEGRKAKDESGKSSISIINRDSKEFICLFAGYGGYFPISDYGNRYMPAHSFGFTTGIYYLNLFGISPELHIRYVAMDSKKDLLQYDSSISQVQFGGGLVYRYHFKLPRNTLTVYGRAWDGFSRLNYKSLNVYMPVIKEDIVEYINVFGISAGCYYNVWEGLLIGVDAGYSVVFTAGTPLQSMALSLNAGYRIL